MLACVEAAELPSTGKVGPPPEVELPACEGVNRPGIDYSSPWDYASRAPERVAKLWAALSTRACPKRTDDGEYVVLSGPCDDDTIVFSGEWSYRRSTGLYTMAEVVAEIGGAPAVRAHGSLAWLGSDPELITADLRLDDGVILELRGFASTRGPDGARATGWLSAGSDAWCLDAAVDPVAACADEPDGYWVLRGAEEWMVVYDGSTACDACGNAYVNGEWAREVCALPNPLTTPD